MQKQSEKLIQQLHQITHERQKTNGNGKKNYSSNFNFANRK
jgi:hypothetical protein